MRYTGVTTTSLHQRTLSVSRRRAVAKCSEGCREASTGQRTYVPQLGRFPQVDPVMGGSANAYDYSNQDPPNVDDLDGRAAPGPCSSYNGKWNPMSSPPSARQRVVLDIPPSERAVAFCGPLR